MKTLGLFAFGVENDFRETAKAQAGGLGRKLRQDGLSRLLLGRGENLVPVKAQVRRDAYLA